MQFHNPTRGALAACLVLAFAPFQAAAQTSSADTVQIRAVLKATWEKEGAPLAVEPVVVAQGHAIAGWAQGAQGGRALLEKRAGRWVVFVCGGDQLKNAAELIRAGVPNAAARELAAQLARAEGRLAPDTLARFSMFKEVIRVDSAHGPGSPAPGAAHGAGDASTGHAGHGKPGHGQH